MNIQDMFDMTGKVAIVTGGGTHLGKAMASALCELGASVTIASRRRELCETVAANLITQGMDCTGYGCDVTKEKEVNVLINSVAEKHGRLDTIVCNAGGSAETPTHVPHGNVSEFRSTLDLNVVGTFLCANAAAKIMVKQGSGAIITVGSIHGSLTTDKRFYDGLGFSRGGPAYQTSKAGIINLTRNLASELGEYGITANCISPGQIPPPGTSDQFIERTIEKNALGRAGVADDLKGAIALLSSPAGAWITGHNLIVDGGWSIW